MSAYDASAKNYLVLVCWSEAYVREVQRPACGGRAHRLRVDSSPGSAPGAARPRQGRHQPVLAGQRARGGWVFEGCSVLRIKHPDTFSHTPFPRVRAGYGELFPPWMQSCPPTSWWRWAALGFGPATRRALTSLTCQPGTWRWASEPQPLCATLTERRSTRSLEQRGKQRSASRSWLRTSAAFHAKQQQQQSKKGSCEKRKAAAYGQAAALCDGS